MKFNEGARLDTSQVQDRRGSGGGGNIGSGGGGLGGLGGMLGGGKGIGGGIGLLVVVAFVLIQMFSGGGSSADSGSSSRLGELSQGSGTANNAELAQVCQTGADANTRDDCRAVGVINSVQGYWTDSLADSGTTYREADTVFYSGQTATGCGTGSSGMGPFYCPADETVYIDLSFWDELNDTFQANGAPFTQAYVIAHEYGHHIQNLLGTSESVGTDTGPTSGAVRLELQADCYAGVWANHASTVPTADGQPLITDITQEDLDNAAETAGRIGDDWIQANLGGGRVDPSKFSHGTAEQRQKWFSIGYQTGDPAKCDTFSARDLG